jgi:nicotinate phosphoribosyltransferase
LTDFYQLSMAYAYWKAGIAKREAVFHLFFRRPPFQGGFTIAAGLEAVSDFIEHFHYSSSDIDYLASVRNPCGEPFFDRAFLQMLEKLRLEVSIDAVPEGTVIFPFEPLLRVQGPLLHCQLLETPLLNLTNFPTLIATKAARVTLAAGGDPVLEFGLRRAQGMNGALTATRAAFIGGVSATSNVLAGKIFDIPVGGTHAHSWVMAFDDEEESFRAYAKALPDVCIFLVDTYDTLEGVKKAIRVGRWLKRQGKKLLGIRLDSGDLAALSIESRKLLDSAGFRDAKIIASNELDEEVISELKKQGSKVAVWGVGTNLVTAKGSSSLDGVYKLSAIRDSGADRWKYTLKLSEQLAKVSTPGVLGVRRFFRDGKAQGDIIYDIELGLSKSRSAVDPLDSTKQFLFRKSDSWQDLLVPIFSHGKKVYSHPSLPEMQATTRAGLATFPAGIKRFLNPHIYPVGLERKLYDVKTELAKKIRSTKRP